MAKLRRLIIFCLCIVALTAFRTVSFGRDPDSPAGTPSKISKPVSNNANRPDPSPTTFHVTDTERVDLSPLPPQLGALPLPSQALGSVITQFSDMLMEGENIAPFEFSELRYKVTGTLVFEDSEYNLNRVQPAGAGPQKMFHGAFPAAHPKTQKFAYVNWDSSMSALLVFDFANSTRSKVFTTENILKAPAYSPDGMTVMFSMLFTNGSKPAVYMHDFRSGKTWPILRNSRFHGYTWNPADGTAWIVLRDCPISLLHDGLCIARYSQKLKKMDFLELAPTEATSGRYALLYHLETPSVTFTRNGESIIITQGGTPSESFFVVNAASMKSEETAFKDKKGETLSVSQISPGPDPGSFSFVRRGDIWIQLPGEKHAFPVVFGKFLNSMPAWIR